jgi:hypothetical protein
MAYSSFRVSSKDMTDYYLPRKENFDYMIQSINQNGYGQIIYNYNGPGDFTVNSLNIYNPDRGDMRIYVPSTDTWYLQSEVGPILWGVTSQEGINFLQGTVDIKGLAKLKYCNNCQDGNGLPLNTIKSFSDRFGYLKNLKDNYGVDEGYIFYDYNLPLNQRWYPSVLDINLGRYVFKNYLGVNKLEAQVSSETGIPLRDITISIESAQPIKPVTNTTSAIIDCCGLGLKYVIDGVYEIGSTIYTKTDKSTICFQVIDNGTDKPNNFDEYSPYKGVCKDCTSNYPCRGGSGSSGGGR